MDLVTLTYTSRARVGLRPADIDAIHRSALTYNPLDGITGLLVFNGSGFLQIIEGSDEAIENLLARLLADRRHLDLEVRDRQAIQQRFFPLWSMYRVDIDPNNGMGIATVKNLLASHADQPLRDVVDQSLAAISAATTSEP